MSDNLTRWGSINRAYLPFCPSLFLNPLSFPSRLAKIGLFVILLCLTPDNIDKESPRKHYKANKWCQTEPLFGRLPTITNPQHTYCTYHNRQLWKVCSLWLCNNRQMLSSFYTDSFYHIFDLLPGSCCMFHQEYPFHEHIYRQVN